MRGPGSQSPPTLAASLVLQHRSCEAAARSLLGDRPRAPHAAPVLCSHTEREIQAAALALGLPQRKPNGEAKLSKADQEAARIQQARKNKWNKVLLHAYFVVFLSSGHIPISRDPLSDSPCFFGQCIDPFSLPLFLIPIFATVFGPLQHR